MDSAPKRPRYRLHWGTVLSVSFVGMVWVRVAFEDVSGVSSVLGSIGSLAGFDGWPFRWVANSGERHVFHGLAFAVDLAVALASLACVGIVLERLGHTRFSFRLSTALAVLTLIALLLGFGRWDRQQTSVYGGQSELIQAHVSFLQLYRPLHSWSWHLVLTINFAMGCTIYVVVLGSWRATAQAIARLRRTQKSMESGP